MISVVPLLNTTGTEAGGDGGTSSAVQARLSGPNTPPEVDMNTVMLSGSVMIRSPEAKVPLTVTSLGLLQTFGCENVPLHSEQVPPPVHCALVLHSVPSLVPPEHWLVPSRQAKLSVVSGCV